MHRLPEVAAPLPHPQPWRRAVDAGSATAWLAAGWRDLAARPAASLGYGALVCLVSLGVVGGLFALGGEAVLFPALAGFLIVGPVLAMGLYEQSRCIAAGRPTGLAGMVLVRPRSGGQVLFTGLLLCLLMLLWMRAAVLIYALFFGLVPFPGLPGVARMLLVTPPGWAMLAVGSVVGGVFAAFAFAISALSVPMLLDEKTDALTAMGTSMALVWHNLPAMLCWGGIVLALCLASLATGGLGLLVAFPLLGHGTWHAWQAMRGTSG